MGDNVKDKPIHTKPTSRGFLEKRNLLDVESDGFCVNNNSEKLTNVVTISKYGNEFPPDLHPRILFSACPVRLMDMPITSPEYGSWLNKHQKTGTTDSKAGVPTGTKKTEREKITYYDGDERGFFGYLEIHTNGFVEQGFTEKFIYVDESDPTVNKIFLRSSLMTRALCSFLIFCHEHYSYHGYGSDLDVFLSIRDANKLSLVEFGGPYENNTEPGPWGNDRSVAAPPETDRKNLQLKERIKAADLSESYVKNLVQKFMYAPNSQ